MSYLLRSMFYVPGHVDKYFGKLSTLGADAIILDIEDSVPYSEKGRARENISNALRSGSLASYRIVVRINDIATRELVTDMLSVVHEDVWAIMPSKINTARDLQIIDEVLSQYEAFERLQIGRIKLVPLIETLSALENIGEIVNSSDRLVAIAFGGEDYLKELGGVHGEGDHTFDYPRTRIAIAAKSAGLQAIDTPYLDVQDIGGFAEREKKSKDLGYEGCLLIHPGQINLANEVFAPSQDEYQKAKRLVEAARDSESSGLSVALVDGVLIGPPMMKQAQIIIQKMELINESAKTN